jgi:hypothetical protein
MDALVIAIFSLNHIDIMKFLTKFFPLVLLLFGGGSGVNAQNTTGTFFWVYPKHADAYPVNDLQTNSTTLNSLFSQYQVTRYVESFLGADTSSILNNAYSISFDGDVIPFYQALQATNLFSEIYYWGSQAITLSEPSSSLATDPNLTCNTPLSFNDPYPVLPANATTFRTDWSIDDTDTDCAWTITTGDPNIIIGFVDTEFHNIHPELNGKTLPDVEITPGAEAGSIAIGCFHGTSTMGDAVAIPNNGQYIAGTGYNTRAAGYVVEALRIGNNCGLQRNADLWDGLWRAGFTDNRPIVNLSWSGLGVNVNTNVDAPPIGTIIAETALNIVIETGTLVVVGAGVVQGTLTFASHEQFAHIPGYVIVGSISITKRVGPTSSPDHPGIDLCAPGKDINAISIDNNFNPTISSSGGTSHAAPYVAGVAALCLDVNPCLTPPELEKILKFNTDPIADVDSFPVGNVGEGYLNAYKAVLAASTKFPGYTVTGNETWDYPRRIDGTLIIAAGAKLTVTSSIGFEFGSKITVEPGGELDVIGGHLKRDCDNDDYWLGIEVKGVSSASQFSSGIQGRVHLTNAIVEDAKIGVSLFRRQTYQQGGGILYAIDSDFINCQKGVAIANYDNTLPGSSTPTRNLSYIRDCTFTINDDFFFAYGGEHIHLDRVTRVNIKDNTLTDERTIYASSDELQNGIWSSNATYFLKNNTIERMRYGVKAENIKSGRTFRATENKFENNFFGISVRAVDNFETTDNEFIVGGFAGPTTEFDEPDRHTGMLVDQSSGFFIEDNDFLITSSSPIASETVGLAIKNTNVGVAGDLNSDANEIFRNTFDGLHRANVANGQNADPSPASGGGLRYFCNQNNTVVANSPNYCTDFTVDGNISTVQRAFNGDAAGNTFTLDNSCNPVSDFDNINGNFINYHYFTSSTGNIEEPVYIPSIGFATIGDVQNQCLNGDSSPGPIPPNGETGLTGQYPTARQSYLGFRQQYANQLDGGDTDYVLNTIASMSNANYGVYQQLYQMSPWLSTEVLLAYAEHLAPTASMKKSLLSANPDGIKGNNLNNSIQNGGWFTTQQITDIETAAQNTTTRTQLEENLRSSQSELQGITKALENYYQLDEADNGLDYANQADWAANGESLDGYLRSIDNRLWAGDITTANNEVTALQAMDMQTKQTLEISYFVELKNLEIDLLNSNRGYHDATAAEISDLQAIVTKSDSRAGIQAQNWLHLLGISEAQAEAYWGTSSSALIGEDGQPTAQEERKLVTTVAYIQVQPNPSKGIFRFHYQPQLVVTEGIVNIYNLSGQMVHQQIINSGNWFHWQPQNRQAGFYFFTLEDGDGVLLQQGKIVYLAE